MKTFGKELREKRLQAGLTQAELATKADVTFSCISKYEHDHNTPSALTLYKLQCVLGSFESMTPDLQDIAEQVNNLVQSVSEQETETTTAEQVTEQDTVDTGITLVEFINDFNRMCESFATCENCPFRTVRVLNKTCFESVKHNPTKAVEVVDLWVLDNPVMTRLDYALQHFPNLQLINGLPTACVNHLFGGSRCDGIGSCEMCWNKPMNVK